MRWRRVEVEVLLFDVLPVVALVAAKSIQPFFQDGVETIPEGQPKANQLMAVAEAADAVFSPTVGSRVRVFKWEIPPRGAVGTVVLPYRSPLTLREVRPPAFPMLFALTRFFQALVFDGLVSGHGGQSLELLPKFVMASCQN